MRLRYNLEWLGSEGFRRDLPAGRYLLGRGGDSDLIFDAPGVSREHAELIVCQDRGLLLRDLGSTNGTRVQGVRISEGAWCGDVDVRLGSVELRLRERSGLDQLALVLDVPMPVLADPAQQPTAAPTATQNLQRELRDAVQRQKQRQQQERLAAWSSADLSALLQAWSQILAIDHLRLQSHAPVVVLAQTGMAGDRELEVHAESAHWQLLAAPLGPAAARALAEVGSELLRWAVPTALPGKSASEPDVAPDWPGLESHAQPMRAALAGLARAAAAPISVLLLGETGVGKELIAQWLHRLSPRRDGPFQAINCAALPRDLLEAELFGVERGAATGVDARPGLLERAHGGSLFLDEVGDTSAETQVRLLRALEDGCVQRLGARKSTAVDVRIIAATNKDLDTEIAAGRFRLDLYHRLAGFAQLIPPLRERRADIVPLAIHFLQQALQRNSRHSPGITGAALLCLQRWNWPGNVRELRQAMERAAVLLHDGEALDRDHLPPALSAQVAASIDNLRLEQVLADAEREALLTALALSGGQHERAWTLLGIGKTSFYRKLKDHRLGRSTIDDDHGH